MEAKQRLRTRYQRPRHCVGHVRIQHGMNPPLRLQATAPAPINIGTDQQIKNGGLGVNALSVFGNSLFGGFTGSNAYPNFGPTSGEDGYGIRDKDGIIEFKNNGGSWASLQNLMYSLGVIG